ncbi:MAG: FAD-binding oxidoreductase [Anderseniella sp.]|jgi:FAD/FMN-containing dehydrogenase|nr:FAD-binding oxidoreductase [Anderseniella sp.]
MLDPDLIARFSAIVGAHNALTAEADIAPHLVEPRAKFTGKSRLVLKPGTTEEVAAILKLANETGTAIVPQGGNTGLVGGQIPLGPEVVVSLSRMNRIRHLEEADSVITVEAGVTLAHAQEAAERKGLMFPLWIASQGTAQVGGNLSTNAGGINVIAYGNTRDLCLGLEVVLASGEVWNGLKSLRKDNTGYDLKHLFIGAEGTLGIITAASMKLLPRPSDRATVFASVGSPADALALLSLVRKMSGAAVVAFEIMPRSGLDMVIAHAGCRDPLQAPSEWYVLFELAGFNDAPQMEEAAAAILAVAFEEGLVADATIATSGQQAGELWRLREMMSEVQRLEGGSIKHDISVPVSKVPEFLDAATARVRQMIPGCRPVPFGHIGDGNIHFNISQPVGADREAFLARWEDVNHEVHAIVRGLGGSISAEHGIGTLKRDELAATKQPVEIAMMRGVKALLDPNGIMNPGKVL